MRKYVIRFFTWVLIAVACMGTVAMADIGPKPSVILDFEGIEDTYYVTLLSERDSTGPYSHGEEYQEYLGDKDAWEKLGAYEDADGYYFLGYFQECTKTQQFAWTYYPPSRFKILIYIPENDNYLVSDIYERYAFDSYFTVQVRDDSMLVKQSYDYTWEVISLICRIFATIAIELLVAGIFGLWKRKPLQVIVITNILTQTILNVLLNISNYQNGYMMFAFMYVQLEILVFAIEAVGYRLLLKGGTRKNGKAYRVVSYALVANIVSFIVGYMVAKVIPGIF